MKIVLKRIIVMLITINMMINLMACSAKNLSGVDGDIKVVRVGISIFKFDNEFITLYKNEMEKYFASLSNDKVRYEVIIQDAMNDQAEQTNQINNFIVQGMDVLIINLVQPSSAATIMEQCAQSGIPVIFINREPSAEDMNYYNESDYAGKFTYVGADARQSGEYQGEIIANLPNKGDINNDGKLQYIMVKGDPENIDTQYRTEFSIAQYKNVSKLDVECLDSQIGNWERSEGQRIVANAIAQYGDKIEVVFCNNDEMALGAKVSIDEAGRKIGEDIYLVGVDAMAEAVALVENGGMTGTVFNDVVAQSHMAVDCAIKAVNGEKLDLYYLIDYVKIFN